MGDDRGTEAIESDIEPRLVDETTTLVPVSDDEEPTSTPMLPPDTGFGAPAGTPAGGPYKPEATGPFTYLDSEPGEPPPVRGDTR